jgi:hypothetical protein
MIAPIVTYGSEIWCQQYQKIFNKRDYTQFDPLDFEKVHNQACKQILGIHKYTPNLGARLELGRIPLSMQIIKKSLRYYVKLSSEREGSLLHQALQSEKELSNNNIDSWYGTLRCIVQGDLSNICKGTVNSVYNNIVDTHNKQCLESMSSGKTEHQGNKLRTYRKFKKDTSCVNYVNNSGLTWFQKRTIARFRLSDHKLKIETGRHCRPRLPPEQRTCFHCKDCIEDEAHFLVNCPLYQHLRNRHIITRECLSESDNLVSILGSNDINTLSNLAVFLHESFEIRMVALSS